MRAAGREGEALFMEVHPWVNWEGMLAGCCLGVLVGEWEGWVGVEGEKVVDRRVKKDEEVKKVNGVEQEVEQVNELDEMD